MTTETDKLLAGCIGAVEANSFESMCLWQQHKGTSGTWVSGSSGLLATVGMIDGLPVCISLLVNVVNGHRVLFYYPTSIAINYKLIEAWLDENLPSTAKRSDGRTNKTDAMHFSHIFHQMDELNAA